jgi:hypothetical protein
MIIRQQRRSELKGGLNGRRSLLALPLLLFPPPQSLLLAHPPVLFAAAKRSGREDGGHVVSHESGGREREKERERERERERENLVAEKTSLPLFFPLFSSYRLFLHR